MNLSFIIIVVNACLYKSIAFSSNNIKKTTSLIHHQRNFPRTTTILQSNQSDDDDEADDEDDYIKDDELNDPSKFQYRDISFGPGRGRSAPSQRKAVGKSNSGSTTVYVCTNCSAEYVNWVGKCSTCQQWNTVQEYQAPRSISKPKSKSSGGLGLGAPVFRRGGEHGSRDVKPRSWLTGIDSDDGVDSAYQPVSITDVYKQMGYSESEDYNDVDTAHILRENRIQIPFDEELNNVLGGGIMPGSLILLGGDPGVGKSTLLLQMAGSVATLSSPLKKIGHGMNEEGGGPVLYVSGEENSMQIASRAMRLGIQESELLLLCETDADFIAETIVKFCNDADTQRWSDDSGGNKNDMEGMLQRRKKPSLMIIDSIQTMLCDVGGSSSAGGVTQVRECASLFLRLAKSTGVPIMLVGHVTKSGGVAGPRTVEHMVDAVLYLEGTEYGGGGPNLRMLRASKNRFGSSEEVGVYSSSSTDGGRLVPVSDPSSFFLADRMDSDDAEGCAISLVLEGIRPMTVEIQALVTPAGAPSFAGKRTVDGIAIARLQLILAVLQKRCGIYFGRQDVYINVVGGVRLSNTKQDGKSSDLAIAISLVSSLYDIPVRSDTAFIGEIGLLGELRQATSLEKRINEARRMGFSRVVMPKQRSRAKGKRKTYKRSIQSSVRGIECVEADGLMNALEKGLVSKIPKNRSKKKRNTGRGSKKGAPLFEDGLEQELIIDDDEDDDEIDLGFQ